MLKCRADSRSTRSWRRQLYWYNAHGVGVCVACSTHRSATPGGPTCRRHDMRPWQKVIRSGEVRHDFDRARPTFGPSRARFGEHRPPRIWPKSSQARRSRAKFVETMAITGQHEQPSSADLGPIVNDNDIFEVFPGRFRANCGRNQSESGRERPTSQLYWSRP